MNTPARPNHPTHLDLVAAGSVILLRPLTPDEVRKIKHPDRTIEIPGDELLLGGEGWGEVMSVGQDVFLKEREVADMARVGRIVVYRQFNALGILDGMRVSIGPDDVVGVLVTAETDESPRMAVTCA
jgi:hypothetical protein